MYQIHWFDSGLFNGGPFELRQNAYFDGSTFTVMLPLPTPDPESIIENSSENPVDVEVTLKLRKYSSDWAWQDVEVFLGNSPKTIPAYNFLDLTDYWNVSQGLNYGSYRAYLKITSADGGKIVRTKNFNVVKPKSQEEPMAPVIP